MVGTAKLCFMLLRDFAIAFCLYKIVEYVISTYFRLLYVYWWTIVLVVLAGFTVQTLVFSDKNAKKEDEDGNAKPATQGVDGVNENDTVTWKQIVTDWAQCCLVVFTIGRMHEIVGKYHHFVWGSWIVYKVFYSIVWYMEKWRAKKGGEPDMKTDKVQGEVKAKLALRNAVLSKAQDAITGQSALTDPHLPGGLAYGQKYTHGNKWPVIDIRVAPFPFELDDKYRLEVEGVGEDGKGKLSLSLKDLEALGVQTYNDFIFHCVTSASVKNMAFRGIPLQKFIDHVKPPANWSSFMSFGRDGYSTNVPREECEADGLAEPFIAIAQVDPCTGEEHPIEYEHGVIRIFYPRLYGWKGSKWMTKVRFDKKMKLGFWERAGGAHWRARVDLQERFSTDVWLGEGMAKTQTDCQTRDLIQGIQMVAMGFWFRLPLFKNFALALQRCVGVMAWVRLFFFDAQDKLYMWIGWKENLD